MEEKLLKITDTLSIHVPVGMGAAAEAQLVASLRADLENPERLEAEYRQIMEDDAAGRTIPIEEILRDLREMCRKQGDVEEGT